MIGGFQSCRNLGPFLNTGWLFRQIWVSCAREIQRGPSGPPSFTTGLTQIQGIPMVKIIASSVRKGNVIDVDGKLYVVLTA